MVQPHVHASSPPAQSAPDERSTRLLGVLDLKYPGLGGATSRRMTEVNRRHHQAYKGCRRTGPVRNSRQVDNPKPKLGSSSLILQSPSRRSAQSQIAAIGTRLSISLEVSWEMKRGKRSGLPRSDKTGGWKVRPPACFESLTSSGCRLVQSP